MATTEVEIPVDGGGDQRQEGTGDDRDDPETRRGGKAGQAWLEV